MAHLSELLNTKQDYTSLLNPDGRHPNKTEEVVQLQVNTQVLFYIKVLYCTHFWVYETFPIILCWRQRLPDPETNAVQIHWVPGNIWLCHLQKPWRSPPKIEIELVIDQHGRRQLWGHVKPNTSIPPMCSRKVNVNIGNKEKSEFFILEIVFTGSRVGTEAQRVSIQTH